jgi:ribonuclease BN (tRNA processing enzyme)
MKATVIGSGTGFPSLRRGSPAVLVQTGGTTVLMDSGPGTLRQLLQVGITISDIDYLLYTHFHPDHTLDFLALCFALKNPDLAPLSIPIKVLAGRGFKDLYSKLQMGYGHWITLPEETINIEELPIERGVRTLTGDLRLKFYPMNHTASSLGYRLEQNGSAALAYSGDTDVCDDAVELGRGTDLFILECSFPEGRKRPGHLTPSLAGIIAQKAHARTLVLNHFYPQCDQADLIGPCEQNFDGTVLLAEDMMSFEL